MIHELFIHLTSNSISKEKQLKSYAFARYVTLTGFETWVFWNNYSDLVNMFTIKKSIKRSNLETCELFVQLWP